MILFYKWDTLLKVNYKRVMKQKLLEEYLPQADDYMIGARRMARIVTTACNRQKGLMVIMEDVHNPHNLAAIARSCDAFGVQQVAFTVEDEKLFDPQETATITAASASKWLDYRIFAEGTRHALTTLKTEGWHIMATWVRRDVASIYELDLTQYNKLALMVGNEHEGLSKIAIDCADSYAYIPMMGMIQSFNVSVAAAISLSEITRQRQQSDRDFSLGEAATRALIADFLGR